MQKNKNNIHQSYKYYLDHLLFFFYIFEIPFDLIKNSNTIGVSSGASAPEVLVDNFINELKNRNEYYDSVFLEWNKNCKPNEINFGYITRNKFLTFIMREGLIDIDIVKNIVLDLLAMFNTYLNNKEKIHELDEVIGNILIFATYDNGCLCELKLNDKIEDISNMNAKKYQGLTQKIVFKCCDFVDEYL